MGKASKSQTKYTNSLNNKLYDALIQLFPQDNIDDLIKLALTNLNSIFELENIFFCIFDHENKTVVQSKINQLGISNFIQDLKLGNIFFEQLENASLAIKDEYICIPIFLKGKFIATIVLVKEKLIRYVDPDYLLLYSQIFSSVLSNLKSNEDHTIHNKKLLENEKLKYELLSTVSHELRTPMSNILGFSELLLKQELDNDTQKQYQEEIYKSAKRLSNLITNFLDLSRIESLGAIQLNPFEKAEPDWLAEEAWNYLKSINSKHEIIWEKENKLPEILCDPEAITRVFINLFTNAIKYSPISEDKPERSKITCSFSTQDNTLVVKISDQGLGIAKDELDKIFDRFYRTQRAQKEYISGTGLGLWISKEIIKAHEGKIWVDSTINSGTSFYLTLPIGNNI